MIFTAAPLPPMKQPTTYILILNCGSSSLKFSLYDAATLKVEVNGTARHLGTSNSVLEIKCRLDVLPADISKPMASVTDAAAAVIEWLKYRATDYAIVAIGHRIVQGGPDNYAPQLLTDALLRKLSKYTYLAPEHLPAELSVIKICQKSFTRIPQILCFDTAFHSNMPDVAKVYTLPAIYRSKGLQRYGFHGLSYEYILAKLAENHPVNKQKIIIAHLGNGASMAAVKNGKGMDTTMGVSPLGGLVMSTRPGDLDPGVLLFLLKEAKLSVEEADELLSKSSGLKAIAGTGDMEKLLQLQSTDKSAALAIDIFCYHARKHIGALAAAMNGLDMLVFTGGIGENSAAIRSQICKDLSFLGIKLSSKRNSHGKSVISKNKSAVTVKVIPTNEELTIARHTSILIKINNQP